MTTPQMFELARFNVISAAFSPMAEGSLDAAYVYAWSNRVFPFDIPSDYARAFEDGFQVRSGALKALADHLDHLWRTGGSRPTYRQLEEQFVHAPGAEWDRMTLISALRYFFLRRMFDGAFYEALLSEAPAEGMAICEPFDPTMELSIV